MITDQYIEALRFATKAHDGQTMKDKKTPYIAHPIGVSTLVMERGGNVEVACAALLHDVVEDCSVSLTEITTKFGSKVGSLVGFMSNPPIDWSQLTNSVMRDKLSEYRRAYLKKLETASPDEQLLSACDKFYNARGINYQLTCMKTEKELDFVFNMYRGGVDATIKYYGKLAYCYMDFGRLTGTQSLGYDLDNLVQEWIARYNDVS